MVGVIMVLKIATNSVDSKFAPEITIPPEYLGHGSHGGHGKHGNIKSIH